VIMTSPHFQLYCFAELSGLINSLLTPRWKMRFTSSDQSLFICCKIFCNSLAEPS
jgi:hypothetical protein